MAEIVTFPFRKRSEPGSYREVAAVGTEGGITVRILSRTAAPHDLLVSLHGTADVCTTVAALPADELDVAHAIAHSTLATLTAAERTWNRPEIA